mgnify:CR=1 FL=1|tara:strand:- start:20 stop:226 length:207 start_codon:yes stop_codon:yes gene_type:complete
MTNSNQITSVKDLQTIRNFFTDEQWDVIDMALNEFQDHDDYVDILDTIGYKLQTVFDKTIEQRLDLSN